MNEYLEEKYKKYQERIDKTFKVLSDKLEVYGSNTVFSKMNYLEEDMTVYIYKGSNSLDIELESPDNKFHTVKINIEKAISNINFNGLNIEAGKYYIEGTDSNDDIKLIDHEFTYEKFIEILEKVSEFNDFTIYD